MKTKQPQKTKIVIRLTSYPATQREIDDQAIKWLIDQLDVGAHPGLGWTPTREVWSVILKRRIAGKYDKANTGRLTWMIRHVWVRQLSQPQETFQASAKYVTEAWPKTKGNNSPSTVRTNANRKQHKERALAWIDSQVKKARNPVAGVGSPTPTSEQVYTALEKAVNRIASEFR